MKVTKEKLSHQLLQYLNHQISKGELIAWCESEMQESSFENETVQGAVAKIGLMDAQNFEMSYEDLYVLLQELGYRVKVELVP